MKSKTLVGSADDWPASSPDLVYRIVCRLNCENWGLKITPEKQAANSSHAVPNFTTQYNPGISIAEIS